MRRDVPLQAVSENGCLVEDMTAVCILLSDGDLKENCLEAFMVALCSNFVRPERLASAWSKDGFWMLLAKFRETLS